MLRHLLASTRLTRHSPPRPHALRCRHASRSRRRTDASRVHTLARGCASTGSEHGSGVWGSSRAPRQPRRGTRAGLVTGLVTGLGTGGWRGLETSTLRPGIEQGAEWRARQGRPDCQPSLPRRTPVGRRMAGWAGWAANEPARACPAPATRPSSSRMRNEDRAVGDAATRGGCLRCGGCLKSHSLSSKILWRKFEFKHSLKRL